MNDSPLVNSSPPWWLTCLTDDSPRAMTHALTHCGCGFDSLRIMTHCQPIIVFLSDSTDFWEWLRMYSCVWKPVHLKGIKAGLQRPSPASYSLIFYPQPTSKSSHKEHTYSTPIGQALWHIFYCESLQYCRVVNWGPECCQCQSEIGSYYNLILYILCLFVLILDYTCTLLVKVHSSYLVNLSCAYLIQLCYLTLTI